LQLIQLRLGGNIDALLSSNLQVPMPLPSLSTGAPSLPRVLSVVIALARRASSSQSSSYIPKESVFRPSISKSLTHLQVEDNSLLFPLEFLSSMVPPSLPLQQTFPIVGQVHGFDSNNNVALLQMCGYP
jgi:hypothetical protein